MLSALKRLGIILLFFLCALSVTAQLPYNHVVQETDLTDTSIFIEWDKGQGGHSWHNGGVCLGGTSTDWLPIGAQLPAYNWNEKYVIIALEDDCAPDKLYFSVSNTANRPTSEDRTAPPIYAIFESATNDFGTDAVWSEDKKQSETVCTNNNISLKSDTRYIKLSYKGNFAAIFSNLKVTKKPDVTITIKQKINNQQETSQQTISACEGSTVTITAEDIDDYCFSQWSDGTKTQSRKFKVTSNTTSYTAQYVSPVTITLNTYPDEGGTATFEDGSTSRTDCPGKKVHIKADPSPGWSFVSWSSNPEWKKSQSITLPTQNTTYTANFQEGKLHTLRFIDNTEKLPIKEYKESEEEGLYSLTEGTGSFWISEHIIPICPDKSSYKIDSLQKESTKDTYYISNIYLFSDEEYTEIGFPDKENQSGTTYTCYISPIRYLVQFKDNISHNILKIDTIEYDCSSKEYTFEDDCYNFISWENTYSTYTHDDETGRFNSTNLPINETNNTLTLPNGLVYDAIFTAYVTQKQHTISATIEPDEEGESHGSVKIKQGNETLTSPTTIFCGSEVTLTATPETCYEFVEWTKGNDSEFKDSDNPLEIDAEDATYIAHFQPIGIKLYLVTLDEDKKEQIQFDYNCGQEYTLKPTDYIKDPCFTFYQWRVEPEGIITGADSENKITIPAELQQSITVYLDVIHKTFTATVSVQPELDSEGKPKTDSSGNPIYHGEANITKVPRDTDDNTEP